MVPVGAASVAVIMVVVAIGSWIRRLMMVVWSTMRVAPVIVIRLVVFVMVS
jgi:hypothetical protein